MAQAEPDRVADRSSRPVNARFFVCCVALLFCLVVASVVTLMLGTPALSPMELWGVLVHGEGERLIRVVVLELRLPRLLIGVLAGAMLALTGVILQDSLRNVLAGPELLGVSAGAAVVLAAITVFSLPVSFALYPWACLAGAGVSGGLVLAMSRRTSDPVRLILFGAAMAALLNAVVITIVSLGNQSQVSVLFFYLLGGLANRTWDYAWVLAYVALPTIPLALLSARVLNALRLGDEVAEGLGLAVFRTRLLLIGLSMTMVAAVVAVCGPIGYVALLAPHVARRLLRTPDAREVLPVAAIFGALLLVSADTLARTLFAPVELPVGIWTTMLGGPVLLILVRHHLSGRTRLAS